MNSRKRKKDPIEETDIENTDAENASPVRKVSVDLEDDDLPAAFTPVKKKPCSDFKLGDLLFAKFKRYPYWPGVFYKYVRTKKKRKRLCSCWVHFFENDGEEERKKIYQVSLSKVKDFTCDDRDEILEIGDKDENFRHGMMLTNDYATKRALGKIDNFFEKVEEEEDDDDDEEEETEEVKEKFQSCFDKLDESEDVPVQHNPLNFLPRQSKRILSAKCKDLMTWVLENAKPFLLDITGGKRKSERHDIFVNGTRKQKNQLKWGCSLADLGDEESEKILEQLICWYQSEYPNSDVNPITYVSEVWLPEAIILSISRCRNMSLEKAEQEYLT